MTVHVAKAQQGRRSGSGSARVRGAGARVLLFAMTALVAGAAGVGCTLLYQRTTAPDTSAVDAQAGEIAEDLRRDLNVGFYSPGHTFGGQFTQGTLVGQIESHGGALLSAGQGPGRPGHTAEVMLGLVPPSAKTVSADAYPVRCYRYTFGLGAHSVHRSAITCPTARTDGKPGSLQAQLGVLLAQEPRAYAYRQASTSGYAHTRQGATKFLKDKRLVAAGDAVHVVSTKADGDDVYVLSLRINAVCHYLRMDSSAAASHLMPLWAAPADEQEACGGKQAATLYGEDPAREG